jgi:hypothetical protein
MGPWCPSCEAIEILRCLYRKCKEIGTGLVVRNSAEKIDMVQYIYLMKCFSNFSLSCADLENLDGWDQIRMGSGNIRFMMLQYKLVCFY